MKVLAISGSLRRESTNSSLLRAIANLAPEGTEFEFYEGLGDLPHFSPELDGDDAPATVRELRERLKAADAVAICTPEYAHGMPGSLKNALDWVVSSGEFYEKPVAAISASPHESGGAWAHASLVEVLRTQGAKIVLEASLRVPFVRSKPGSSGEIADPELAERFRLGLEALFATAAREAAN